MTSAKPFVLFVCRDNTGRSRMAEASTETDRPGRRRAPDTCHRDIAG